MPIPSRSSLARVLFHGAPPAGGAPPNRGGHVARPFERGVFPGFKTLHAQPQTVSGERLSDFTVIVVPEKTGWRVTGGLKGWRAKEIEGRKGADAELRRSPRPGVRVKTCG